MSAADRQATPGEIADAAQRRAADPDASAWVMASAGSGKTKLLIDRLLRLLLAGIAPRKILCLTYTKTAAAEMNNRIAQRLSYWATVDDQQLRKDLESLIGERPGRELMTRARHLFALLLDLPGGMRIVTIHSFCQSVLARFPIEADLTPHFRTLDEAEARELLEAARHRLLARAAGGAAPALAAALVKIAESADESGFETAVGEIVAARDEMRRMIEAHGELDNVLAALRVKMDLKPEDDAASLLRQFVADDDIDIAGLKAAAAALAESSPTDRDRAAILGAWLAARPDARAAMFEDYRGLFLTKEGKPREKLAGKKASSAASVMEAERERVMGYLDKGKSLVLLDATEALLRLGVALLDDYAAEKRRRACLDYDDLIEAVERLLSRPGIAAWVLYKLDGGIDHILIDEAQDTAPAQWRIVEALAEEFFVGRGAGAERRSIFAVGDAKQSIFSFQGADRAHFIAMREAFKKKLAQAGQALRIEPLDVSFRSVACLLEAVDRVFARDAAKIGLVEATETIAHHPHRLGMGGEVELWQRFEAPPEVAGAPWELPATEATARTPQTQMALTVARRIDAMIGREELPARERKIEAGDILVLVRRRNRFVDELVRELKRLGRPVAGVDRLKLAESLAVMDLVALGRFLLMPEDDLTLATLLKGPLIGFDEDRLFDLAARRGRHRLWAELRRRGSREPGYAAVAAKLSGWLGRVDYLSPFDLYAEILGREGGRRAILGRLGSDAGDPIDEFLRLALESSRGSAPSLEAFLDRFERGESEIKRDLDQDSGGQIRIMTVHGAKGLQAPVVFLPDTDLRPPRADRLLWEDRRKEPGAPLPIWLPRQAMGNALTRSVLDPEGRARAEEERRLLYVAMTRAEDRLVIGGYRGRRAKASHGDDSGEAAPGWYDLIATGLGAGGEPARRALGDAGEIEAKVWRTPQTAAPAPDRHAARAAAPTPLPDFAGRPAAALGLRPRPLTPSRPAEAEPAIPSLVGPSLIDRPEAPRFQRGEIIHRLLQSLPELAPAARPAAMRRFLSRKLLRLEASQQAEIADSVERLFADPALAFLWQGEVLAEQPICGSLARADGGEWVVSGQIDRLVIGADAVEIVDYKTHRQPPESVDLVPALYWRQMASYRALLRPLYPNRSLRCHLLWTETPQLMTLPDSGLDRALA